MRTILWMTVMVTSIAALSCSSKKHQLWTATKSTPVYATESDTEQRILFTLHPGDVCRPMRDIVMKAYLHTEIRCKNGHGWVIDKQNFDIKSTG